MVKQTIPLLRVADVERSMAWYEQALGFVGDPFFEHPYVFAILNAGTACIMIKRVDGFRRDPDLDNWDVYVRVEGIREIYGRLSRTETILRPLERMPYNDCEFDVQDPDGYVLCVSELLEDSSGIPACLED